MRNPDHYLRTVARRAGVPDMWLDDAVQEIRIAHWKAGAEDPDVRIWKIVAQRQACDFVRHLLGARRSAPRPKMISLEELIALDRGSRGSRAARWEPADPHDMPAFIEGLELARANLPTLTPGQRAALALELSDRDPTPAAANLHQVHLSAARRRLRKIRV